MNVSTILSPIVDTAVIWKHFVKTWQKILSHHQGLDLFSQFSLDNVDFNWPRSK